MLGAAAVVPVVRGDPHSPQNLAVAAFGVPHVAQTRTSGVPHSPQNFRPGSFSVPHAEQINRSPC
jgi:hypothetical protein